MRRMTFIAIGLWFAATDVSVAAPSAPAPQCAAPLSAIGAVRKKLDLGREVLSADEADCAFLQFTLQGMSEQCARLMERATPRAKRVWSEMVQDWETLGRLRLDLRKLEDSLNIVCEP
jgi:hypothetical protein